MKAFNDKVLATEDDIFEECSIAWTPNKKILLEDICDANVKLEEYIVLSIMIEINSKVAMCGGTKSASIRVDWLDRGYKEIHKERENHELVQNTLRVQIEKVRNKSHQAGGGEDS